MKRHPALRQLSDDHHQGLVLALRAKKAAAGDDTLDVDSVWQEVVTRFARELEPHFRIEEQRLSPALLRHGEQALIERLDCEHAELRQLASRVIRNRQNLARFGELLQQHIRFEERELFEVAQQRLTEQELAEVERGS